MAKKRTEQPRVKEPVDNGSLSFADALNEDVLKRLQEAKKELSQAEDQAEQARKERVIQEKKEREANKSFAELLEESDMKTHKH